MSDNGNRRPQPDEEDGARASRARVAQVIRDEGRFFLVTHENPDGDALGSLVATQELLTALGKDSVAFMAAEEFPLPYEYRFFELDELVGAVPADVGERVVIFLDCGNIDRQPAGVPRSALHLVNIDHHHDNTHFGTINHVVPWASSTAELVWELARELGVTPTPAMANALYVGLVTDTGRFSYENTTPRAHEMAADLIEAGVDVQAVYRRLFEGVPLAKLRLLGRALEHVQRYDDGRLTLAWLSAADFEWAGAEESYSEGIIDNLRAVEGTAVAALVRELLANGRADRKVSLRASDGSVDVSAIARAQGGGGHPRAAGFSTDLGLEEIVAFLRDAVAAQLAEPVAIAPGRPS